MSEYIELLRVRPGFRFLWSAAVVSLAGDWFNTIASVIIVNRYTDSGLAVSYILIARSLPVFLFGPYAGVIADRFNRRTVMVVCDFLRVGIVLMFLLVNSPERVWLIYMLTTIQFIVSAFYQPASNAILPSVVEGEDELLTANVLRSVTWSAMLTLGAAIGGVFAVVFGAEAALVVDSASFLFSGLILLRVPQIIPLRDEAPRATGSRGWLDFVDGIKYVSKRPRVFLLTLVKTFNQVGNGDIIAAIYAERLFRVGNEGAGTLTILFAAAGLGAVTGPMVANRFTGRRAEALQKAIQIGFLIVPIAWALIGWAAALWIVAVGFFLRMVGVSMNWTYSSALIQMSVPDNFLGRVFALDLALFTLMSSTVVWLSGYLMDKSTLAPTSLAFIWAMGCGAAIFLWPLFGYFQRRAETRQTVGEN